MHALSQEPPNGNIPLSSFVLFEIPDKAPNGDAPPWSSAPPSAPMPHRMLPISVAMNHVVQPAPDRPKNIPRHSETGLTNEMAKPMTPLRFPIAICGWREVSTTVKAAIPAREPTPHSTYANVELTTATTPNANNEPRGEIHVVRDQLRSDVKNSGARRSKLAGP
jgi:hypothetical protein